MNNYTAILHKEGNLYVSFCPEVDIASQGETIEEAKENLKEAIQLFFEHASENEKKERVFKDLYVTTITA